MRPWLGPSQMTRGSSHCVHGDGRGFFRVRIQAAASGWGSTFSGSNGSALPRCAHINEFQRSRNSWVVPAETGLVT